VTFRRHTSEPILYDDDVKQITAKIGAIPSIGGVSVVMQYWGGQACTSSHDRGLGKTGAAFTVEFLQDFGDVPLLYLDWSKLTHRTKVESLSPWMYVQELRVGTRAIKELRKEMRRSSNNAARSQCEILIKEVSRRIVRHTF
jgi:hypothetical protein